MKTRNNFTAAEIDLIVLHYAKRGPQYLAKRMPHSAATIAMKARKLEVQRGVIDGFLTASEAARHYNVDLTTIIKHAKRDGVHKRIGKHLALSYKWLESHELHWAEISKYNELRAAGWLTLPVVALDARVGLSTLLQALHGKTSGRHKPSVILLEALRGITTRRFTRVRKDITFLMNPHDAALLRSRLRIPIGAKMIKTEAGDLEQSLTGVGNRLRRNGIAPQFVIRGGRRQGIFYPEARIGGAT